MEQRRRRKGKVYLKEEEKEKQVVERGVEERELTRTVVHVNDLGHVPFRYVRVERCLATK